jgi:hypothetical protein
MIIPPSPPSLPELELFLQPAAAAPTRASAIRARRVRPPTNPRADLDVSLGELQFFKESSTVSCG